MKVSGGIVCGGVIDGENGNDAVVYSLEATPGSLNFRSDAVGNFTSSLQTTCKVMKTVGAGTPQQLSPVSSKYDGKYYLFYRRVKSDGTVSSPIAGTTATVSSSEVVVSSASAVYVVAIEFLLSTVAGVAQVAESNIVKRSSVGISVDGHQGPEGPESTVPGPPGATGKMFFPMGVWSETQTYERNTLWIPLVWRDDPNTQNPATGHFGNFWYLNPDVTSSYGNDPNTDNGQHWLKANSFGLVITQGIFAEFAKLGKAIMSGDCMFSMNGCVDGSEIINGNQWKSMVAYTLFAGDPVAKAVSAGGSKIIGTSDVSLHDGAIQLSAGETLVVKIVVTARVTTTRLRLYVNSTAVKFDFLSSAADTSWETTSNPYLGLAVTTYFIRYTATADCSCYLRAYKTNGSGEMRYTLDRLMFEPNWWVDLLTGKMSGARGNFVVNPDGSLSIAKDKFTVDENGDVVANNITIKGSLMYHNVGMSDPSASEQGAQLFTMYDANGNVVTINGSATVVKTVLNYDTFILTGAKRNYTIFLPPAVLFPGTKIKIVNGTYSGSTGDLTRDLSTITLSVVHRSDTEAEHEDNSNEEMNSLSAAIPFDISNGGVIFGYRTEVEYKVYGSVELISMLNPESPNYTGTLKNHVWMIVDAH